MMKMMSFLLIAVAFLSLVAVTLQNVFFLKEEASTGEQRNKWERLWHDAGFMERFVLSIPALLVSIPDWYLVVVIAIIELTMFWTGFNILLNLMRGLPMFHKGTKESHTTSFVDLIFRSKWLYWTTQLVVFLCSVIAVILYFK